MSVLTPSVEELRGERDRLLGTLAFDETDLRERGRYFLLTRQEERVLRRIDEIDYLLGED